MAEFDPSSPNDLKRMRSAAAGMIKDLLAARLIGDDSWDGKKSVRQQWFRTTKVPQGRSAVYLLNEAVRGFEKFSSEFVGPSDSVPAADSECDSVTSMVDDSVTSTVELRDLLCQFTDPEDLRFKVSQLRNPKLPKIEWHSLAQWDLLPQLRALLDRLPESLFQKLSTVAPDLVYYESRKIEECPDESWRLLNHLVNARTKYIHLQDLAVPVWEDHAKKITAKKIDPLNSRTSDWLRENKIPYRPSRKGEYVYLKDLKKVVKPDLTP